MRVLIFGLGGVGQIFAGFLKKGGHHVTGIGRQSVVKTIEKQGITITGIWGEHQIRLDHVHTDINELPVSRFDLILISVKSFDTKSAVWAIKPYIDHNTLVVCAQNGYGNYETACAILEKRQVILTRLLFGVELLAPGSVKVSVCGDDVIVGSPENTISREILESLAQIFSRAGIPSRYSPDIIKFLWGKILYNCSLNALGATLEVPYGTLGDNNNLRKIMDSVVREIFAVAKFYQIPFFWDKPEEYLPHFYEKLLPLTSAHHSSMLQDIQMGKKTEIDALNGAMVTLGKKAGIDTPINWVLTKIIKAKEAICMQKGSK